MSARKQLRLTACVAGLALFAGLPASAEAKKVISISGSTSVFPLTTKLARKWLKTPQGAKYAFSISQGGSNVGVSDAAAGRVTAGESSRDPAAGDPGGLVFTRIARDAVCLVTNNANPLANITQAQVQGIFGGPITISDWSKVPGAGVGGAISPQGRATTSGTHDAFRTLFLGTKSQASPPVSALASNGLVQQAVKGDPNSIGYVSLAFTSGIHPVAYNGVDCNLRNAKSGAYGAVRSFYYVTQGAPAGGLRLFINWVTHNKKANKIIDSEWVGR